jgi:uncharacterized protein YbjT (DUF2867 family)
MHVGNMLMVLSAAAALGGSVSPPETKILVVGATGGTGTRALRGLLDAGLAPAALRVITRDPSKPALEPLRRMGVEIRAADLDDPTSLAGASASCTGCYVHSTAGDTKKLDTGEVPRARNLAEELRTTGSVRQLVFNSAAGEPTHGVKRIAQKHAVEVVLSKEAALPATHLRANLFMEELWKSYTRPPILKGSYPFSLPPDRDVYLTNVRDMGRLAGTILTRPPPPAGGATVLNVASDVLTPTAMAEAFAAAQGTPCVHKQARLLRWIARFFFPDLHEVLNFYRTSTETTDVPALREQFPGLLTPFADFLAETDWGNVTATYEDLATLL